MQLTIMGCGRLGATVATSMASVGHKVYIIDVDEASFRRLPGNLLNDEHIVPIVGDGTSDECLRQAQIEEAEAFVAVSGHANSNALAAQMAQSIFNIPRVVCRIDDPVRQEMYNQLGLVALSSVTLLSDKILEAIGE